MTQLAATDRRPDAPDQRRRSGLPRRVDKMSPPKRILTSHRTWIWVGIIVISFIGLVLLVREVVPDRPVPGGTRTGIGIQAWREAFRYAWPTALVLVLIFVAAGRWRPRALPTLACFAWGAGASTFISLKLNTWAAGQLSIIGDGDPQTGTRAAVFVAPFTEEASKGTVLFILAMTMRYAWVNRLSGLVLGAVTGVGFAFVENLIYYGRIFRAAAQTSGAASPDEAIQQLAFMRGVLLAFGHPLFTMMIGLGLAVALRARSRIVRVLAPLVGFVIAALLHMIFNSVASLSSGMPQMLIYIFGYWGLIIAVVIFACRQLFRESKLVDARLTDYARTGQLQPGDPQVMSRLMRRGKGLFHGLLTGALIPTFRMQKAMVELAYLRDSITRGLVDEGGIQRERELLAAIFELRHRAVVEPYTRTPWPKLPWRRERDGPAQLGSARTGYTADRNWAPPGGRTGGF